MLGKEHPYCSLLSSVVEAVVSSPCSNTCGSCPLSMWEGSEQVVVAVGRSITAQFTVYPLPTVSTRMMSKPAPSQSNIVSFVVRVTPPKVPDEGEALMYALGSRESSGILVLSPSSDPKIRHKAKGKEKLLVLNVRVKVISFM